MKKEKKKVVHLDPEGWARKVKRRKRAALIAAAAAVLGLGAFFLTRDLLIPAVRYASAEKAETAGRIQEAISGFASAGSYRGAFAHAADIAFGEQEDPSVREALSGAEYGDTVEFGRYEQDGDPKSPEPIKWTVLKNENGRLLLLSESVLDASTYNPTEGEITWAACGLRAMLNEEFFNEAFTEEERLLILAEKLANGKNPVSGASGGPATLDRVFLLSLEDMLSVAREHRDFDIYGQYAFATKYAISRGVEVSKYRTTSWWTRTPGSMQENVMYADAVGSLLHSADPTRKDLGVRPAIWVFAGDRSPQN